MKSNEFEKWLNAKMDSLQFEGNGQDWKSLQEKITRKRNNKTKKIFLVSLKAAGIMLPFLCLSVIYYMQHREVRQDNPGISLTPHNDDPVATGHPGEQEVSPAHTPSSSKKAVNIDVQQNTDAIIKKRKLNGIPSPAEHITYSYEPGAHITKDKEMPIISRVPEKDQSTQYPLSEKVLPEHYTRVQLQEPEQNSRGASYGLYAGMTGQNIGSFQYQLSISGRVPINERFSFEALAGVSATDLALNQTVHINGIAVNSDMTASEEAYTGIDQDIELQYRTRIYAVGIKPGMVYHINPTLNISSGFYAFRNLNTHVPLAPTENQIISELENKGKVNPNEETGSWDIGIAAGMEYQLSRKIGVNLQYIQGLNNYYSIGNTDIRRSGIQVGLRIGLSR
ncbi:MAG: porin family protein [Taibaiella sp.]|nr:porin family protein [Taibaiella sp.]